MDHVADGDAFQRDRRAILEPRGILKVGAESELLAQTARPWNRT
jgi:hypothetical protein